MSFRLAKLRFRRMFRRRRRQLTDAGEQADAHLERNFFKRLHHLLIVKRFLALWIIPILILIGLTGWQTLALTGYYQHDSPTTGGIYQEGIIGQFTNANPIYAVNAVDESVSRLVFAGLFKYNDDNQLVGDLASDYNVSKDGRTYIVKLRPHLTWQDGRPLTAADVVFTYQTIQNPLAQSPLAPSWQGVEVAADGPLAVTFTLPNPLSSFKYSLTNGIVPKHILGNIAPGQLRSIDFNTQNPIGAGPFEWQGLSVKGDEPQTRQELVALTPFDGYHAGEPKLSGIIIHSYPTGQLALQDLKARNIDGLAGLSLPPAGWRQDGLHLFSLPLSAETMVFFRESSPELKDAKVRQALILASNRQQIINSLPYKASAEREPLLPNQVGYSPKLAQPSYDLVKAKEVLKKDGWKLNRDGLLQKKGQVLEFNLFALDNPEFRSVASALKSDWQQLGVDVNFYFQDQSDFQNTLSSHDYDAVLHTISVGVDPDEYIYWDSTQADVRSATRLNLSEFRSSQADNALAAGRTRQGTKLRTIKYQKFLKAWLANEPALVLYQPRFLYVTSRPLYNFDSNAEINSPIGRYRNVSNWEIRESKALDN